MNITEKQKCELLTLLENDKIFGIEYANSIQFKKQKFLSNKLPLNLELLSEYASKCSLCSLSKSKVSFNFDFGDKMSNIMMVSVDKINVREFDNLKNLFNSELEIDINHIYMTNILKCTSKIKKVNFDNEIFQFLSYLEQQIRIMKPKIIITIGFAFNYLMNRNDDIRNISGTLYEYDICKVVPLLGLDFLNKNPSYKVNMINDLKKIKKLLDEK